MTADDLPWMHELFRRRYPKHYDPIAAEGWYLNNVLRAPLLFLACRSDAAFLIAAINAEPWTPTIFQANVLAVCADDRVRGSAWQAIALMRGSLFWAKTRGCAVWRITSETDFDLEPLVRRIWARKISPRYEITLKG